jgi:hypothetical protein
MSEKPDRIVAQLVLGRPAGSVTAATVGAQRASKDQLAAARRALEQLGFKVEAEGPLSLSFSGPAAAMRDVFGLDAARPGQGSGRLPAALAGVASDVVIPPEPEFFR